MFSEDDLLPISGLQHIVFCERRAALIFVDGLWAENTATVEGVGLHQRVDSEQKAEVRGNTRIARGMWLRSLELGLAGKADVVEFSRVDTDTDGEGGVKLAGFHGIWTALPIEYKRGRARHEKGYEIQLCAQAMCLEEMLGGYVSSGAVFFGQSRRRVNVPLTKNLREDTRAAAARLREVLVDASAPRFEVGPKCRACSLQDLCVPTVSGRRKSAGRYLFHAITEVQKEGDCVDY